MERFLRTRFCLVVLVICLLFMSMGLYFRHDEFRFNRIDLAGPLGSSTNHEHVRKVLSGRPGRIVLFLCNASRKLTATDISYFLGDY